MTIANFFMAHEKDLGGGFKVQRVLPAAAQQAVGPFIFFDHLGPVEAGPGTNHDVRPHPHIGLATVTYLYEGAILHRDSLGSVQRIEPGAINWMTAGSGIVHSERTPPDLAGKARRTHGLQLWAALPREHEEDAPSFCHTSASDIPVVDVPGARIRVLIGRAFGQASPVAAFGEALYLDIKLEAGAQIRLGELPEEAAIYPVLGAIAIDGEPLAHNMMALLEAGSGAAVTSKDGAQFVVIGGAPLDSRRFIAWNFVSSSKERIARAAQDWERQRYPGIPGETEFIPLPDTLRQYGHGVVDKG